MFSIGVVHLVRQCNEISAFREFIDSYRSHPAGIEHDLILVFKGFDNETIPDEYRENLSSIRHQALFVGDEGFDLGA